MEQNLKFCYIKWYFTSFITFISISMQLFTIILLLNHNSLKVSKLNKVALRQKWMCISDKLTQQDAELQQYFPSCLFWW
jgi:hypothetical protein